jgi:hypothetical protein
LILLDVLTNHYASRSLKTFANDLNAITAQIRARTVGQIKEALRQKAYAENGIPLDARPRNNMLGHSSAAATSGNSNSLVGQQQPQPATAAAAAAPIPSNSRVGYKPPSAEVTLNALNATANDNEVDVEGLGTGGGVGEDTDFDEAH